MQSLRKSKDLKHHNIQDLQTRQYTVPTRQYLETHQLQDHVLLVTYITPYILHIQDIRRSLHPIFPSANLHQVHFHSQGSQGADGDSFLEVV
jgi:hypothetical protein